MKLALSSIILVLFLYSPNSMSADSSSDSKSDWALMNNIYFENIRLSAADTVAGYAQLKAGGVTAAAKTEIYAVVRMGMDSRTNLESSNNIYNDNYLFAGAGADYLGLGNGIRLTFQVGGSVDLNNKIHQGGFDYRLGTQTFHEIAWNSDSLTTEVYSEALYFRRYRNFLGSIQLRNIYHPFHWNLGGSRMDLGPVMNLVSSVDALGLEFNNFVEVRIGPRLTFQGPLTWTLTPYYAWGARWLRPTSLPDYQDFRVLLTGSISI